MIWQVIVVGFPGQERLPRSRRGGLWLSFRKAVSLLTLDGWEYPRLLRLFVEVRVTFPFDIWRLVDVRWQDLGYPSVSAYLTGLIRYDLLVGGPHSSTTADPRSKLQRKLTRKTLARRKGGRRKILRDRLIEEAEGHPVPQEELQRVKTRIAKALRDISIAR